MWKIFESKSKRDNFLTTGSSKVSPKHIAQAHLRDFYFCPKIHRNSKRHNPKTKQIESKTVRNRNSGIDLQKTLQKTFPKVSIIGFIRIET